MNTNTYFTSMNNCPILSCEVSRDSYTSKTLSLQEKKQYLAKKKLLQNADIAPTT